MDIKVGVQYASQAAAQFIKDLEQQSIAVKHLSDAMVTINDKGEVVSAAFKALGQAGERVLVTLKANATGFQLLSANVDSATASLRKFQQQEKEAALKQRVGQADTAEASLMGLASSDFNPSQASAFEASMRKIRSAIESGKVELTRFQKIYDDLTKNPKAILPNLTADEAKVTAALRNMMGELKKLNDQAKNTTDGKIAETTMMKFANKDYNVNQINAFEQAMRRVRSAIESGKVELAKFQEIYKKLTDNPKAILPGLTAEEAKVAKALRTMMEGFDKTGDKAQRAAASISISFAGMARLVEAQIIKRITGAIQSSFIGALDEAVKTATEFSIKIAEIQTISQKAGMTNTEWADGIRRLSSAFGTDQLDVAAGAYDAISNQVARGADTFTFLESALRLSRTTLSSTADSVNLLSSAIKSFDLPVSEADRVAALFFKTIDLGRVRASDLANTFGRVGILAKQAGASIEETLAAIATLTVRGVKPADAMTLLSNLFLKLIQPTDEMKGLFSELGVSSGEAAIQTFGLTGVLRILEREAGKGGTRMAELLGQIRAIRAQAGLSGAGLTDFADNFAEITQGQKEFAAANEKVNQSIGKKFNDNLARAKVFFEESFGDQVVRQLVNMIENFQSWGITLERTVAVLSRLAQAIGGIALGYAGAVAVARLWNSLVIIQNTLTASNTVATNANTAAQATNTSAMQQRAAAMANTISILSTFFSAGYLAGMIFQPQIEGIMEYFGWIDKTVERMRALADETAKLKRINENTFADRVARDPETMRDSDMVETVRKRYQAVYQIALQAKASEMKLLNDVRIRTNDNLKDSVDRTKISSKALFDFFGNNLKALNKSIEDARTMIQASLKSTEETTRRTTQIIFDAKMKFASDGRLIDGFVVDDQRLALIKNRLNELSTLARTKFKEGTKESVDEARKLYSEVEKLTADLFDKSTENQRRAFEDSVRRGTASPTGFETDPVTGQVKARFEFVARTAEFERQINGLARERLSLESNFRAQQEARIRDQEAQVASEKERLRILQQAFEQIQKISLVDKGGNTRDAFKDNPAAALNEFDRLTKIILDQTKGESFRDQFAVFGELRQQRIALEQSVAAEITAIRLKTEQATLINGQKTIDGLITKQGQALDSARAGLNVAIKDVGLEIAKISTMDVAKVFPLLVPDGRKRIQKVKDDTTLALQEVQDRLMAFSKDSSLVNYDALQAKLQALIATYKEYVGVIEVSGRAGGQRANFDAAGAQANLERLSDELRRQVIGRTEARDSLMEMFQDSKTLGASLSNIPDIFERIAAISEQAAPRVQQSIREIVKDTAIMLDNFQKSAAALRALDLSIPARRGERPVELEGNMFGGHPKYLRDGGFVGFVPRGSDRVPAMLGSDEFVMTGNATRQFLPILKAMNSGGGGGSNQVTNIGDVNINVGGNINEMDARSLAREFRRGVKRGTLALE